MSLPIHLAQIHGMSNILHSSIQPLLLDPYPVPGSVRGPGIQQRKLCCPCFQGSLSLPKQIEPLS